MEKKTYYVAVGSGEILEDITAASFEFEIEATEDEFSKLEELFKDAVTVDEAQMLSSIGPWREYQEDEENNKYDKNLYEIYKMIYQLGKPKTRDHIEKMGVLRNIKETGDSG